MRMLNDLNFVWDVERGSSLAQLQRVSVVGLPNRKRKSKKPAAAATTDGGPQPAHQMSSTPAMLSMGAAAAAAARDGTNHLRNENQQGQSTAADYYSQAVHQPRLPVAAAATARQTGGPAPDPAGQTGGQPQYLHGHPYGHPAFNNWQIPSSASPFANAGTTTMSPLQALQAAQAALGGIGGDGTATSLLPSGMDLSNLAASFGLSSQQPYQQQQQRQQPVLLSIPQQQPPSQGGGTTAATPTAPQFVLFALPPGAAATSTPSPFANLTNPLAALLGGAVTAAPAPPPLPMSNNAPLDLANLANLLAGAASSASAGGGTSQLQQVSALLSSAFAAGAASTAHPLASASLAASVAGNVNVNLAAPPLPANLAAAWASALGMTQPTASNIPNSNVGWSPSAAVAAAEAAGSVAVAAPTQVAQGNPSAAYLGQSLAAMLSGGAATTRGTTGTAPSSLSSTTPVDPDGQRPQQE